jgi:hypothetical protein
MLNSNIERKSFMSTQIIVKLSIIQRLNLEGLIRQQRSAPDDSLETFHDLFVKVQIPDDERLIYVRDDGRGNAIIDRAVVEKAEEIEVTLEKAEARKMLQLIDGTLCKTFNVDDLQWIKPLRVQLREYLK